MLDEIINISFIFLSLIKGLLWTFYFLFLKLLYLTAYVQHRVLFYFKSDKVEKITLLYCTNLHLRRLNKKITTTDKNSVKQVKVMIIEGINKTFE